MRTPLAWNDAGLLADEPFASAFLAISQSGHCNRRSGKREFNSWLDNIADNLQGDQIIAAKAWVQKAFASPAQTSGKAPKVTLDPKTKRIFVHFYWRLSRYNPDRQRDCAEKYLNQERSNRGYEYSVGIPTKGQNLNAKKSSHSSHHITNKVKKEVLGEITRSPSLKMQATRSIQAKRATSRHVSNVKDRHVRVEVDGRLPSTPVVNKTQLGRSALDGDDDKQTFLRAPTSVPLKGRHLPESNGDTPHIPPSPMVNKDQLEKSPVTMVHAEKHIPVPNIISVSLDNRSASSNRIPLRFSRDDIEIDSDMTVEQPDYANIIVQDDRHILPLTATPVPQNGCAIPANGMIPLPCSNLQGNAELDPDMMEMKVSNDLNESHHPSSDNAPRQPSVEKLPLPWYPPIWAQSRQEVCESFDWFRSYQGGVYHTHNYVKGYLLSAFSSKRDIFEHGGRLIISHGGGKAESIHKHQGKLVTQEADDQRAQDKSVRALLTNFRESRPLVLLIDDKYELFPYDLSSREITYAVLGFYTIAHAWAEYQPANNAQGRVVRYKFAFQWCEGQGEPWWAAPHSQQDVGGRVDGSSALESFGFATDVHMESSCSAVSTSIASQIPRRPVKLSTTKLVENTSVGLPSLRVNDVSVHSLICTTCNQGSPKVYKQAWTCLNPTCRSFWIDLSTACSLPIQLDYDAKFLNLSTPYVLPLNIRDIRPNSPELDGLINTTYPFSRGMHCRACGRLSCRLKWEHWECMHCHKTVGTSGKLRVPEEFWNEKLPVSFLDHYLHPSSGIKEELPRFFSLETDMAQVQTFILPNAIGFIHHIQALTPLGNRDADDIFKEYQEHASAGVLKFRRWPLRAHKCRGPLLTNYFSQNSGEPYQYVGGTANTVPFSETSTAVRNARDLIQQRVSQALGKTFPFNEVLSAAYMERQKMAFHSDSERGLGPVVAGLSLGSPALMHFRALCQKSSREESLVNENNSTILTVVLRHGDILVMDGAGVQKCYEHTVVPTNFRIAATARYISPAH